MDFCCGYEEVEPEDRRTITEILTDVDEKMYEKKGYSIFKGQKKNIERMVKSKARQKLSSMIRSIFTMRWSRALMIIYMCAI